MITISRQDNGVLFTFENSDKYLYGNGTIEVPFNSLSIIADESDMITLRKAASNDIFLSARYDTDLGYRSKDDAIDDLKGMLFAEIGGGGGGSGVTPSEVQEMIDESISGKADTSAVTAVANDVSTISGQVATKVATSDFNAYSAATDARIAEDEEVTAAALNNLDERIGDPYQKVSGLTIQYNIDGQTPEVAMEFEDDELGRVNNLFNKWGLDAYSEDEETGHQSDAYINNDGSMGVFEHSEGQEGNEDEGMSYDKQLDLHPDSLEFNTQTNGTDYEQSENVTISKDAITMYKNTNDNGDITESTIEINNNQGGGDGVFINLNDGSKALDLNTTNFDWTDGSDSRQINWGDIASLNDIPEYSAGTGIEISGNVISATGGGSVTVDPTLDSGSTNPVANSAITAALDTKISNIGKTNQTWVGQGVTSLMKYYKNNNGGASLGLYLSSINGKSIIEDSYVNLNQFSLVETSAITSAMTSSSTDAQVPSAKAVYDTLGGLKLVKLSQSEYDQLATKDPDTLYIITNVVS